MNTKSTIFVLLLIAIALIERLVVDLGPNVELVTLTTFLAAFYISRSMALAVPLIVLAISDVFLGNTSIALFTWSAYALIGLAAVVLKKHSKGPVRKTIAVTLGGQAASVWFYIWTNFGVWLLDSWGMYPKTLSGLFRCYVNGLPFLKNQMIGNLFLLPLGFIMVEMWLWAKKHTIRLKSEYSS